MQDALEKERKRLEKAIEEKEKERRTLHLDEMEALQKRIEDLQQSVQKKDAQAPRHINYLQFWHTRWKCIVCRRKTSQVGRWTCPYCNVKHMNVI